MRARVHVYSCACVHVCIYFPNVEEKFIWKKVYLVFFSRIGYYLIYVIILLLLSSTFSLL